MTARWAPVGRTERAASLACPPGVARWLHDEVVQRLSSVSAALGSGATLREVDRVRCGVELDAALGALRLLLNHGVDPPAQRFRSVAEAVRAACAGQEAPAVRLSVEGDAEISATTGQLVADFVAEAMRNAAKHACAETVSVTVAASEEQISVVACNDGVGGGPRGAGAGVGLRLLAARALDHGGFVSTGATRPGRWMTTLVVARRPAGEDRPAAWGWTGP